MNERRVTPSCGCVFCDIGVAKDKDGWHKLDFGRGKMAGRPSSIKCSNAPETDPA